MKKFIPLFVIILLAADSCRRVCGCFIPPPPKSLNFEIIAKDGNSLVTSLKDSVTLTYADNNSNQNKSIRLTVKKLYTNFTDTTTVSPNYNGLYVTDFGQMCILSSEAQPVTAFNLNVNGIAAGIININYTQYQATYPYFSLTALSFNNTQTSFANGVDLLTLY